MIELQEGDIVFCRDWTPVSWWIRRQQGDFDFSHVCVVGEYGKCIYSTGGDKLLWFGCIQDIRGYFKGKKIAIGRYEGLDRLQKAQIITWCQTQVGKNRYPIFKVLSLAVRGLLGRMVRDNGPNDSNGALNTFCAESVALAYAAAGIFLTPKNKVDYDAYTPEIIWNDPKVHILYNDDDKFS